MKTIENNKNGDLDINDVSGLDIDTSEILREMVNHKLESLGEDLKGKHFYNLKVTKIPTRTDYHTFSFERLSEISRKLINGQTTLGGITNRQFWNRNFIGGFRVLNVEQNNVGNEFPIFTTIYFVYSNSDNLDVKIQKTLSNRLRNIDPTLTFSFNYIGEFESERILKELPRFQYEEYPNNIITKLGEETIQRIYNLEFQTPKYFGQLFKSK